MSIKEVPMYRVVCDEDGCDASPQDSTDYFAWANPGSAIDDAVSADWAVRDGLHLCEDHGHRTVCMGDDSECPRRDDLAEADDGWMYCPEHLEQGMDEATS